MTKSKLIGEVAAKTGITGKQAGIVCEALLECLSDSLARGEDVVLSGFGAFSVRTRSAHMGRNPKTGEAVEVPSAKTVGFTAGKTLKEKINET